jgi:hypothetical protein
MPLAPVQTKDHNITSKIAPTGIASTSANGNWQMAKAKNGRRSTQMKADEEKPTQCVPQEAGQFRPVPLFSFVSFVG